jgi:hypothetical protein
VPPKMSSFHLLCHTYLKLRRYNCAPKPIYDKNNYLLARKDSYPNPGKWESNWTLMWTETYALEFALRQANHLNLDFLEVRIISKEFHTSVNLISTWKKDAEDNGERIWSNKAGRKIVHQSGFQRIDTLCKNKNVTFIHVGDQENELGVEISRNLAIDGAKKHTKIYCEERLQPKWTKKYHLLR